MLWFSSDWRLLAWEAGGRLTRCSILYGLYMIGLENIFISFPLPHPAAYGQGSNPSCSCYLKCSCGNARSFNLLCQARDQTCMLALQRCHPSHCTTVRIPGERIVFYLVGPELGTRAKMKKTTVIDQVLNVLQ